MNEQDLYKSIGSKEQAIKDGLLETQDLRKLQEDIEAFLDTNLKEGGLLYLKYKKFKAPGGRPRTLWSFDNGYPNKGYEWIKPWIDFFEEYLGEKTIKHRLESENLWVESRIQGGNKHLMIGKKDGSPNKVHIVIDGQNGEIRIDKKDQAPEELLSRIEAVFTLTDGRKIKTTREGIELEPKE